MKATYTIEICDSLFVASATLTAPDVLQVCCLGVRLRSVLMRSPLLQMMGRAGRPQFDQSGIAVILVEESKKNFYKKVSKR